MPICPKCDAVMEPKGNVEDDNSVEGIMILFQCPKCKNVELRWKEFSQELRMSYP